MHRRHLSACLLIAFASPVGVDVAIAAPSRSLATEPATPDATSFAWSDERPDKGRPTTMEADSLGVTTRVGDAALPRPPPDLVRAWLQHGTRDGLAGKPVALLAFEVEFFEAAPGNRSLAHNTPSATVMTPNLLATIASNALIKLINARSVNTLVSSRIEATVAGRKIVGMSRETIKGRLTQDEVDQVIRASLDDLRAEVDGVLAAATDQDTSK